ncbi:hypothetical protein [Dongia deserti]|uniref:hypothetical protein n=1 Tax=Dongia deserti TaxID=2268030 RepID=UPI000E6490A7|nr:hypothetical protein [Dongia deserti]
MTMQHLGMELRHIANRAFIDFVTPAQRAWFRRCIVKVTAGEELGIITADLQTGAVAPQPFFVTARPAKGEGKWWLMLAANLPEALRAAVRKPDKPPLASGHEFMLLVESAAQQAGERLDLMRVNAAILTDEMAASPETRANLQAAFDQVVLNDAYDGIASRTGAGEYLLLRDREVPSGTLLARLGEAAESHAIPRSQLGLETSALQLSSLGSNLNPAGIRRAAATLRNIDRPVQEWEGVVMEQPFWLRPAVLAFGLVAILAIGWLIV